jgi:hypothetical protein
MTQWLLEAVFGLLLFVLRNSILLPMLWSGKKIRIAREEIRALNISLYNAQQTSPGACPTASFYALHRKHTLVIAALSAIWVAVLVFIALGFSGGLLIAGCVLALIIVGYFNVTVTGVPQKVRATAGAK